MSQTHVAFTTRIADRALCGARIDGAPTAQVNPNNPNAADIATLALQAFSVQGCQQCFAIVDGERRALNARRAASFASQ